MTGLPLGTMVLHALATWVDLAALALSLGAVLWLLWVLPRAERSGQQGLEGIRKRIWSAIGIAIPLFAAAGVAEFIVRSIEMSGALVPAVLPLLPSVLLKTHYGHVWLLRTGAVVALCAGWLSGRGREGRAIIQFFMLGAVLVIAMTRSASGHASDAGDFSGPEIFDLAHLLAAASWAGGLIVFLSVVRFPDPASYEASGFLQTVAGRFVWIETGAALVLVSTALLHLPLYVGTLQALVSSVYGRTIIAKAVFFCVLGWLLFLKGSRLESRDEKAAALLVKTLRLETALAVVLLLFASFLRHEVPARHFLHMGHAGGAGQQGAGHAGHEAAPHGGAGTDQKTDLVTASLRTTPEEPLAGEETAMLLKFSGPDRGPVRGLTITHDRLVHVVIVGADLLSFAHIHPEDIGPITDRMRHDAAFGLRHVFPEAGTYLVAADIAVDNQPVSKIMRLKVRGKGEQQPVVPDLSREKRFGDYTVSLVTRPDTIRQRERTVLEYRIEKNGKPVTDLEPYLSAPMHIAVVRSDLGSFLHTHGMVPGTGNRHDAHGHTHNDLHGLPEKFGPSVEAEVVFAGPGLYKIFGETMHGGKVRVFDFMVEVK